MQEDELVAHYFAFLTERGFVFERDYSKERTRPVRRSTAFGGTARIGWNFGC